MSQLPSVAGAPSLSVWCSTLFTPTSASTRVVTISTCLSTITAANCALTPLLQAVVTFDDYPAGVSAPSTGQCVTYCGTGQTIGSWVWSPVAPTVTAISLTSGPSAGGTPITITGTGFVTGSIVTFVQESGRAPGRRQCAVRRHRSVDQLVHLDDGGLARSELGNHLLCDRNDANGHQRLRSHLHVSTSRSRHQDAQSKCGPLHRWYVGDGHGNWICQQHNGQPDPGIQWNPRQPRSNGPRRQRGRHLHDVAHSGHSGGRRRHHLLPHRDDAQREQRLRHQFSFSRIPRNPRSSPP